MNFIESALCQFRYYKSLGEGAMRQIPDEALLWQPAPESNSIAVIIRHLHGNMLSRFTNFRTEDGEKDWRRRDEEFTEQDFSRETLVNLWNAGWACVLESIATLKEDDLCSIIFIRNEGHTVQEAILRQLCHYPYHVGQIVFIAKMHRGTAWHSLSIPRNASSAYNAEKFSQEKTIRHFTDGLK